MYYYNCLRNSVSGLSNTSNCYQHLENEKISVNLKQLHENEDVPVQNEGSNHEMFLYDQNPADLASLIAAIEKSNESTVFNFFCVHLRFFVFKVIQNTY